MASATWFALDFTSAPAIPAATSLTSPGAPISASTALTESRFGSAGTHVDDATVRPHEPYQPRTGISSMANPGSSSTPTRIAMQPAIFGQGAGAGGSAEIYQDTEFVPFDNARRDQSAPPTLEITPGIPLPAVLLDSDESLPPQAAAIKDRIAEEFEDATTQTSNPEKPKVHPDAFRAARDRADDRYRMFFGDTAYNRVTMSAAKQALKEAARK